MLHERPTKFDDEGRTPREAHVSSRFCMTTGCGLTTTRDLPRWLPMLYILCSYKERAFCCWKGLWNMVLCQIIFFLNKDMRWPLLKGRLGIPLPPTSPWPDTRLRTDVFGRGERNQPTHLKLTVGKTHLPLIQGQETYLHLGSYMEMTQMTLSRATQHILFHLRYCTNIR